MANKTSDAKKRRGPRGIKGKRGAPGIEPREIHAIVENIEKIQDEAALQFKRTAQIQVQIDATLKALKDMGERAGRQRKKR
jgi:hypothetical protein